ncbi:MAG: hypothetical protein UX08_C0007G0082 [Candidatus Collierbacteria bacterium GW2011_GWB1_45_35]|uniref:Uncharacterized protein n=2 Tax=Candidatus Collieribacteriota TaxID=1752725 RepID=A0A0G1KQF3_9BACT|nr:MAG: hypothetical protein UW48_C0001G0027 [Microgenomates group bacterium GW2011_GWC1_44_23]KKT85891.1 MAG: hypothetical protein UW84_C0020G0027 [Candidatus Collierbacteria bacterium GW2011_GWA2_44_99]KKT96147.1 MAG: hypothetical protein UW96_C0001G0025 [Candidatus Collierbacteria bacterium GW2011_GWA1_45_15]KKU01187.1 MAG: hypothetical protein UX01_C0001G0031 [Candidatus Collierbacteria bacterium GW2011_GWB2_45_17]KKU05385.1 MAG: hypothetical protein UX08_C0007G0082 [Candidatus Collierbacte
MEAKVSIDSEKTIAPEKEYEKILALFCDNSGLDVKEVETRMKSSGLDKIVTGPKTGLLKKLFPDEKDRDLREIFQWIELDRDHIIKGGKIFQWLDLVVTWTQIGSGKNKFELLFPVVADNALVQLKKELHNWETNLQSISNEINRDPYLLEQKATVTKRVGRVDDTLRRINTIGIKEIAKGRIPVTRVLSFTANEENNNPEISQLALDVLVSESTFGINNQSRLVNMTLADLNRHKAWPEKGSPLTSWSFASLNNHPALRNIAVEKSIIQVSSLPIMELCWSRDAIQAASLRDDLYPIRRWYVGDDLHAPAMDNKMRLDDLGERNIHAGIFQSEDEATVWGNIPNLGVFNLL